MAARLTGARCGNYAGPGERADRVLLDGADELLGLAELLTPPFVRARDGAIELVQGKSSLSSSTALPGS